MKTQETNPRKQLHRKGVGQRIGEMAKSIQQAGSSLKTGRSGPAHIDTAELYNFIAVAAYYRAEKRGFVPGGELQDWLEAEAEIEQLRSHP
ncbi:MAG: DUF2934 domain-containing protein [Burkholderiales bacterium]